MKSLIAFIKKEFTDQLRCGRLLILGLLFVLFGIMNPAIAKLTPWLLETMADSLAESGMIVTDVKVSALDSWLQFFKNMPMGLIAFVLLESSIFTKEFASGTLVLSLTKGLERYKVVVSKTVVLTVLWTLCYWMCFGITCGYNAYFWDNSIAQNLIFSVVCWWIFSLTVIALMVLISMVSGSNTDVLLGTGAVVLVSYVLGLLPKLNKYLPTHLMDGNSLIYGLAEIKTYLPSLVIAIVTGVISFAISIPVGTRFCLQSLVCYTFGGCSWHWKFATKRKVSCANGGSQWYIKPAAAIRTKTTTAAPARGCPSQFLPASSLGSHAG